MSVLRPLLSRRGRLVFVAAALLLIAALVAAPSVSGARPPNAVKQFTASISPTTATAGVPVPSPGFTVTVTNCGGAGTPDARCTLASTIGLGSIRILVPTEFRPIGTPVPSSPNWTASYNPATGNIIANVTSGSNKLQPGETVDITFSSTPTTCPSAGDKEFTTAAWGSTTISGSDPFAIQGAQPVVTLAANASCVTSGGTVTGPNGQTETITGDFEGHVSVIFGGEEGPDCSRDAGFGALGDQWEQYQLPTQVTITPADDFIAGEEDKISTSEFPLPESGGDSSWFLICFAVPQAGHSAFETRGGGTAISQPIGGIAHFVGILASCADAPTPCVSEQFLTTGPGAPPWSPGANKVHIAVRMDPGDPYKR